MVHAPLEAFLCDSCRPYAFAPNPPARSRSERNAILMAIITGTNDPETLTGTAGDDVITGLRGNDLMRGGAGNDVFVWNPGDGSDTIDGQTGFDTLQFNGANINE